MKVHSSGKDTICEYTKVDKIRNKYEKSMGVKIADWFMELKGQDVGEGTILNDLEIKTIKKRYEVFV